jgi:hypothetical protein
VQEVADVSQALALAGEVGYLSCAVARRLELRDLVAQEIQLPQACLAGTPDLLQLPPIALRDVPQRGVLFFGLESPFVQEIV